MNLTPIFIREIVLKSVREFFSTQNFHEVIAPVFSEGLPVEPNIYPFESTWKTIYGDKQLYMSVSPESALKKMIALGIGNCFAIGKCFRNLEAASKTHNPEFLMLEWYRKNQTYEKIMEDTQLLIKFMKKNVDVYLQKDTSMILSYQGITIDIESSWNTYSLVDLFKKYADISIEEILDFSILQTVAATKGYSINNASWGELYNQIFLNEIEPHLGNNPCFLIDFPSSLSPLCRPKKDTPYLAERFEVYLGGMEIGNGNTEYTDTKKIRQVFLNEQAYRQEHHLLNSPIDEKFLDALDIMKQDTYAGIGLGIDRLAMIFADVTEIKLVEPLLDMN